MDILKAFAAGGAVCVIGQILIDKTKLTPARILSAFVAAGALAELLGIYGPFTEFAGAGALVPLTGFGSSLCRGALRAVEERGAVGIFTGALSSASAGLTAALVFGFLAALIFRSKPKK